MTKEVFPTALKRMNLNVQVFPLLIFSDNEGRSQGYNLRENSLLFK